MPTKNSLSFRYRLKELLRPSSVLAIGVGFLGIVFFVIGLYLFTLSRQQTPPISDQNNQNGGQQQNQDGQKPVEYTVVACDSTWKLAERFYGDGRLYPMIEQANDLRHNQWLEIGMVLVIPEVSEAELTSVLQSESYQIEVSQLQLADTTSTLTSENSVTGDVITRSYTVQIGDSLWKIAANELGDAYQWQQLYSENKTVVGVNPDLIYPGQILFISPNQTSE